jgi:hypothetical protein
VKLPLLKIEEIKACITLGCSEWLFWVRDNRSCNKNPPKKENDNKKYPFPSPEFLQE